jgi:hypothetical protein
MVKRASDYGLPRIRVRRLPDERRLWRRHPVYEVELTEFGAAEPAWTKVTDRPGG